MTTTPFSRHALATLCALGLVAAMAGRAAAGADGVLTFDGAFVLSPDGDRLSDSRGFGAHFHAVDRRDPFLLSIGGVAAIGEADGDKAMRDIYDIHFNFGFKMGSRKHKLLLPFASLGVDFLYVGTRQTDGSRAAGMTMGLNVRGGFMGYLGDNWMYHAGASYIGAIVPGTGEGLDGLVFQVGVGKKLFD